jgi:hypothetical protein
MGLVLKLIDATGMATTKELPPGEDGTEATVKAMRGIIDAAQLSPLVQQAAANMRRLPESLIPRMLYDFLRERLRFVDDPAGFEVLQHPDNHLREMLAGGYAVGDCDDHAIVGASILKAAGFLPVIITMNDTGETRPFSHVFFGYRSGRNVVPMDPQEGVPIGTLPARGKRYAVEPV